MSTYKAVVKINGNLSVKTIQGKKTDITKELRANGYKVVEVLSEKQIEKISNDFFHKLNELVVDLKANDLL